VPAPTPTGAGSPLPHPAAAGSPPRRRPAGPAPARPAARATPAPPWRRIPLPLPDHTRLAPARPRATAPPRPARGAPPGHPPRGTRACLHPTAPDAAGPTPTRPAAPDPSAGSAPPPTAAGHRRRPPPPPTAAARRRRVRGEMRTGRRRALPTGAGRPLAARAPGCGSPTGPGAWPIYAKRGPRGARAGPGPCPGRWRATRPEQADPGSATRICLLDRSWLQGIPCTPRSAHGSRLARILGDRAPPGRTRRRPPTLRGPLRAADPVQQNEDFVNRKRAMGGRARFGAGVPRSPYSGTAHAAPPALGGDGR
jgi:hypothetical protein